MRSQVIEWVAARGQHRDELATVVTESTPRVWSPAYPWRHRPQLTREAAGISTLRVMHLAAGARANGDRYYGGNMSICCIWNLKDSPTCTDQNIFQSGASGVIRPCEGAHKEEASKDRFGIHF